jgi:hypothetical protein
MKALGFGLVFGGVVIVSACSSSPSSDCSSALAAFCQKYFQCAATAAAQQYGTESACEKQFQTTCANLACTGTTTYHSDKIDTCRDQINAIDCSNPQTPAACNISATDVCY